MTTMYPEITPWVGIGEFKLYSTIRDFNNILCSDKTERIEYDGGIVRYEINGNIWLFFSLFNQKLFKATALLGYPGKMHNGIQTGMDIKDVLKIDPTLDYDDFEEVYFSNNGIFIETDPIDDKVITISVYIKELETEAFDENRW